MNAKRLVVIFFIVLFMAPALLFGSLYVYDPLSIFHKPFGRPFTIHKWNSRIQNISLIKHTDFDSIILGNSFTANTSAREAGELFGGTFLNLSMDGSGLYEQSIILEYVLRTKSVKTVVAVMSEGGYEEKGHGGYPLENWNFLYDNNPANDIKAYLNMRYLSCLGTWSTSAKCVGFPVDMDTPAKWDDDPGNTSRFGGIDAWIRHADNAQLTDMLTNRLPQAAAIPFTDKASAPIPEKEIIAAIERYTIGPAQKNPDTHFYYFFNPSSMVEKAVSARYGYFTTHAFWVEKAVRLSQPIKNISFFSLDTEDFTEDIANYKDPTHYARAINSLILRSIHSGHGLITPDNVERHLLALKAKIQAYDITAINEYIQAKLSTSGPTKQK